LLCLRVVALYDQVKWLQALLWVSLGLTYAIILALLGLVYTTVWKRIVYSPLTRLCLFPDIPSSMHAVYVIPIAIEILIITLIIIKAYENAAALRSGPDTPIVCSIPSVLQDSFSFSSTAIHIGSRWPLVRVVVLRPLMIQWF
jgi:hypothetical protein